MGAGGTKKITEEVSLFIYKFILEDEEIDFYNCLTIWQSA